MLESVRKSLRPEKNVASKADPFIRKLQKAVSKYNAEVFLGGSLAKGTFLKGSHDADVFVRFPLKYKGKEISDLTEAALKSFEKKYERVHGSRDYFHIKKNLFFEVVPVLKVSSIKQADNVTDMSPLHVAYVKKRVKGLEDEVRLAKQFCKALRVYGAESFVQGFSGHVLELLVIYYGSFSNLLKQASVWGNKVIIDPESKLSNPSKQLNQAKTLSPLILVDPVQDERNAAAALSNDSFYSFIEGAREFLAKPSKSFFKVKSLSLKEFNVEGPILQVKLKPLEGKNDVVGSKLKQAYEKIFFEVGKFAKVKVTAWDFSDGKSVGFIALDKLELPKSVERVGPPTSKKTNAIAFKKKHPKAKVVKGKLVARVPLEFKTVKELIKSISKKDFVSSRCKGAKIRVS